MLSPRLAIRLLLLVAFCLSTLASARAQSATATLSGTVVDPNGAVIGGADITVTNAATGLERQASTGDNGTFTIPLLPPSTYTLSVAREGFATAEVNNVVLNVGDQKSLKIQLKAGDVKETVQVTSESALIDESPAVATTVDRVFVENIPLNGRSFNNLLLLSPGVSQAGGSGFSLGGFNVNGQRSESNYFTIDGVGANTGTLPGSIVGNATGGALPPLTASGGTQSMLNVDEMQEFTLQTSTYGAKFGRQPGGQVSIATRSGTNEYHGTLFEYFRNEAFDANDWFANRAGLKRPVLRQHDFGGVFGGPLPLPNFGEGGPAFHSGKDSTFFFFSYEGLRLKVPRTTTFIVPSVSFRNNAHPALLPLLNAFPLPNAAAVNANQGRHIATFSDPQTTDSYSVRLDHNINNNVNIFGRYHDAPSSGGRWLGAFTTRNELSNRTLTLGSTWAINSKMANDLRFNFTRSTGISETIFVGIGGSTPFDETTLRPSFADPSAFSVVLLFLEAPSLGLFQIGKAGNNIQRQINVVDDFTLVHGNHRLQFGADYRRINPTQKPLSYRAQHVILNSVTGQDELGVSAIDAATLVFHNFSLYGDDTWKVTPRLTLTLGLRWELVPPPTATEGAQPLTLDNFNDLSRATLAPAGTPIWETRYDNFAPRLGAAYIARNETGWETVLRGGFGFFYDLGMSGISDALTGAPYLRGRTAGTFTFPGPIEQATPPPIDFRGPYTSLRVNARDLELPLTYQWNFAVEQSLGANQTITASYVGSAGRDLIRRDAFFTGVNPALLVPNPTFNSLTIFDNGGTSAYKALQLQFQRRLTAGFQALVNYTLSRSEDTASADTDTTIPGADVSLFRGVSSFDRTHIFSSALTYNIPSPFDNKAARAVLGGWSVDGIFRAESAPPVNVVITTTQGIASGRGQGRPDLVEGVPTHLEDPTAPGGRRINPAAFTPVPPSAGRLGNAGRNPIRGFGFWQADMSLRRQFNFGEKTNLQLRVEAFNVFNHPNFSQPDNRLGNFNAAGTFIPFAGFGRATSTLNQSLGGNLINPVHQVGGPRSMQLALRFNF